MSVVNTIKDNMEINVQIVHIFLPIFGITEVLIIFTSKTEPSDCIIIKNNINFLQ